MHIDHESDKRWITVVDRGRGRFELCRVKVPMHNSILRFPPIKLVEDKP